MAAALLLILLILLLLPPKKCVLTVGLCVNLLIVSFSHVCIP